MDTVTRIIAKFWSFVISIFGNAALTGIGQGISLQQLRQAGVIWLVTMKKDDINGKK